MKHFDLASFLIHNIILQWKLSFDKVLTREEGPRGHLRSLKSPTLGKIYDIYWPGKWSQDQEGIGSMFK